MEKRVTFKDVLEAMRQNGYPQIAQNYITVDLSTNKVAGCAFGQAGLNLDIDPDNLHTAVLNTAINLSENKNDYPFSDVVLWNDNEELSPEQIAGRVESQLLDANIPLDTEVVVKYSDMWKARYQLPIEFYDVELPAD